jgi:hypothetical protein
MKHKNRSEELKAVIIEFKKTNSMSSLFVRMRNDGYTITAPTVKRFLDGKTDMLIGTGDLIEEYIKDPNKGKK